MEKCLFVSILCVAPQASGKGLAVQMIEWTEKITKKLNFHLMTTETTGLFSAKAFRKCGFHPVKELEYNEYITPNGDKPLKNLDPHISCIIWEKSLI